MYRDLIADALNRTGRHAFAADPATVALIERWMRDDEGGYLDHLGCDAFDASANLQLDAMLTGPEVTAMSASAEQLDVPAWTINPNLVVAVSQ